MSIVFAIIIVFIIKKIYEKYFDNNSEDIIEAYV